MAERSGSVTELTEASTKKVLVCLGDRKREVSFLSKDDEPDGKNLLKETVKVFSDVLVEENDKDSLVLQLKNEEWDGDFIDVVSMMSIPDKSVLKAIIAQPITHLKQRVSKSIN